MSILVNSLTLIPVSNSNKTIALSLSNVGLFERYGAPFRIRLSLFSQALKIAPTSSAVRGFTGFVNALIGDTLKGLLIPNSIETAKIPSVPRHFVGIYSSFSLVLLGGGLVRNWKSF